MKCTHIKRLLPLYIGGDLPIQQADSVRAHLFACQHCNDLADDYSESASWLNSEGRLDFDEHFFDELRDSVWRSVRAEQNASPISSGRRYAWLLLFASAAAVIVLAAVPLLRGGKDTPATPRIEIARDAQPGTTSVVGADTSKLSQLTRRAGSRRTAGGSQVAVTPQAIRSEPGVPTESSQSAGEETASSKNTVRRIEIQTADPNIRIIWLVREPGAPVPTQADTED